MKIVCTRKNLNKGLVLTSKIISSGSSLPILNNILLKTEEGRLKLAATNLEMAINTWVVGKVEENGEITIPARLLNDYVSNIPAEKISLTTQNQTLYLETDKAKTHIKGLGAEEFPLIPKMDNKVYAKFAAQKLQSTTKEVVFAASYTETQPEISGVLFSFSGQTLTLAATDRYRLSEGVMELEEAVENPRQVIVPARAVSELSRVIGNGIVEVFLTENQVCFKTAEAELTSRLIEGEYPDYKQIIPKHFTTEVEINRLSLIQSLRATSLFATENNNIELDLNPQVKKVIVKSQSAQAGDSEVEVDGEFVGEKNSIIFNYRYLLECLNNLSEEKVVLKVIGPSSPAAIAPLKRENYLYIVMPIKI